MVPVTLHTHTSEGSDDAAWSDADASAEYADAGFVTAVTDHDTWTDTDRIRGVEHTIAEPGKLHIVELEDGFRFLAHPRLPFPTDTRERAAAYVRDHGLDGVEKYSRGIKQYSGSIGGVVELANDDAHNPFQVGLSHMLVDAPRDHGAVLAAIKRGDFEPRVAPRPSFEYCAGRLSQAVGICRGHLRGSKS